MEEELEELDLSCRGGGRSFTVRVFWWWLSVNLEPLLEGRMLLLRSLLTSSGSLTLEAGVLFLGSENLPAIVEAGWREAYLGERNLQNIMHVPIFVIKNICKKQTQNQTRPR